MQVNLSLKDLRELLAKHQAGEPLTLEEDPDEITVHIPATELPELLKDSPAAGRATIDKLETNAVFIKITDPVKASVKLSDFRLHGDKISAQTNLSFIVRKAVDLFLRAKKINKAYFDDKRVVIRIPQRVQKMIDLKQVKIDSAGITIVGKLKKDC